MSKPEADLETCPACCERRRHTAEEWDSLHDKPKYVKGAGIGGTTLRINSGERWEDNPEVVRVGRFRRIDGQ